MGADKSPNSNRISSKNTHNASSPFSEDSMHALVHGFSKMPGNYPPTLLRAYGQHLFKNLAESHAEAIKRFKNTFSLLVRIENYVHMEILKLHPDAELPSFEFKRADQSKLEIHYSSIKEMGGLAEGVIESCIRYFNEDITVKQHAIGDAGTDIIFTLEKND